MTTREITIQGLTATVAQPYVAGHVVTEAEAKALNQTRAEAIRNNCASRIKARLKELGLEDVSAMPADELAAINQMIADYDSSYEFTLASVGASRTLDPIEKEARKIARDTIKAALADKGRKVVKDEEFDAAAEAANHVRKSAFDEAVEAYADSAEVMKMAKKVVETRQTKAAGVLESVGI